MLPTLFLNNGNPTFLERPFNCVCTQGRVKVSVKCVTKKYASYPNICAYNTRKNIWQKLNKSRKIRQERKNLFSA